MKKIIIATIVFCLTFSVLSHASNWKEAKNLNFDKSESIQNVLQTLPFIMIPLNARSLAYGATLKVNYIKVKLKESDDWSTRIQKTYCQVEATVSFTYKTDGFLNDGSYFFDYKLSGKCPRL